MLLSFGHLQYFEGFLLSQSQLILVDLKCNFLLTSPCSCLSAPSAKSMLKLTWSSFAAKICGEDGQVDPNCFVTAQSIVFNAMEQE